MLHVGLLACVIVRLIGPAGDSPIRHGFETGSEGWVGQKGQLAVTATATDVHTGKGALQFTYSIAKGEMNHLALPVMAGSLAKAASIRLWVKTDESTSLLLSVQEKGGGRYMAAFACPKAEWQQVEISPSDFRLNEGKDDPRDSNGKLDMDQVEAILLADFSQFFAQADPAMAEMFNLRLGPRSLILDDFDVSDMALAVSPGAAAGEVAFDEFLRPQAGWIAINSLRTAVASGKPLTGKSLQIAYTQAAGKISGGLRAIRRGSLAGMTTLKFTVASSRPCKLMVQLEETSGGKYNTLVEISGDSKPQEIAIPFAELIAADDSKDDNSKLDPETIHQFLFLDFYGVIGLGAGDNTLWLGSLKATM